MLMLKDSVIQDIFQFLDSCECEFIHVVWCEGLLPPHCACFGQCCSLLVSALSPRSLPHPFSPSLPATPLPHTPPHATDTVHGRNIPSVIEDGPLVEQEPESAGKNTVAYQARLLKALFLRVT